MTSRCHWMPFYPCDYLADTGHLSTLEHGAYLLLIMHYWQKGGLPADEAQLARICRLQPYRWRRMRDTIAGLFQDGWKHKRIDEELAKAEAKRQVRVEAATRTVRALHMRANNGAKSLKNNNPPQANASTITSLSKDKERGRARASGEPHASPAQGAPTTDAVILARRRSDVPPDVQLSEEERKRVAAKFQALSATVAASMDMNAALMRG